MVNPDCQIDWIETPRRSAKHTTGCVCEGVSRDH
jgi:hypothetical protein